MTSEKLYVCDPTKNEGCEKSGCAYKGTHWSFACFLTRDPAMAMTNEEGQPIECPEELYGVLESAVRESLGLEVDELILKRLKEASQ